MTDHAKELERLAEIKYFDPYEGGTNIHLGRDSVLVDAAAEIRRLQDFKKCFEYVRALNLQQYSVLYERCLKEDLRYDDFVLKLANGEEVL